MVQLQTFTTSRSGEPEPVGARGCFWLLGAKLEPLEEKKRGAGAASKKKSGAGAGKN